MKSVYCSLAIATLLLSPSLFAKSKPDGSDLPACTGVTNVCMAANVTDSKNGKTGYLPGEWKEKTGLWANCVAPLAKGKAVAGVSGVSQAAAQACLQAYQAANKPAGK